MPECKHDRLVVVENLAPTILHYGYYTKVLQFVTVVTKITIIILLSFKPGELWVNQLIKHCLRIHLFYGLCTT